MKIIPAPKKLTMGVGVFSLGAVEIALMAHCDNRIPKATVVLKKEIEAITSKFVKMATVFEKPEGAIFVSHAEDGDEGYTLKVCESGIEITGNSAAGAFYGIQTLRQMIKEYGAEIPCCEIEDKPDFAERGFYHDITRGRVTTLETMKKITDQISYFKINSLQIYVEDAFDLYEFDGTIPKDACMNAEEMVELDDYCYNHFVELVPSLSTFGHLYTLLDSEKYRHLCEFENYQGHQVYWLEKQHHHTIDASNPESIEVVKSMIDQYIPLFRSNKFNICCDETMDLCRGRNAGKDEGELYFYFVNQIIEHVKKHGKQVQMWGDVVLAHMDLAKKYLMDVTVLTWNYTKVANEEICRIIEEAGIRQIVCPGTSSWNRFVEELDRSVSNISGLARHGKNHGAVGILNTNWGDFGNICPWNCEIIGMVVGAECGWNPGCEIGEDFQMAVSLQVYNSTKNVYKLIYDMGMAERSCDWMEFVYWYSANTSEGRVTELKVDEEKCIANMARIDTLIPELKEAIPEGEILSDLILSCRAIKLMNKVHLMINGNPDYQDRAALGAEWAAWYEEYRVSWLREDKLSQLDRIGEFLESLTTLNLSNNRQDDENAESSNTHTFRQT